MSIVKIIIPAGKTKCKYGITELGVDFDGTTEVPRYVAKTLVTAGATSSDPLSETPAALLAESQGFELNYIRNAYGAPADYDAAALLAARGEPAVVFE